MKTEQNYTVPALIIAACCIIIVILQVTIYFWLYANDLVVVFNNPMDFATLLLTASALLLTGAAFFVALVAVWGYRDIKKRAVEVSVRAAERAARETAEAVAARTIFDARGTGAPSTSNAQASEIASAVGADQQ